MKRVLTFLADWPLWPYNLVLVFFSPVILALKAWRYWKKNWKREYDLRRWFIPQTSPADAGSTPHVVIIATGWGEMRLAALLDAALKEKTNVRTTWVLRDGEAASAAMKEFPNQAISFLPFDFLIPVLIWLRRVRPDCVVFVEKFWFPNFVRGCKNWGAKLMVVNARTRAHDSARYKILEPFHRWIAGSFEVFLFQSESDLQRAARVLSPRTKTSAPGNLKFALRPTPDASKTQSLERWLGAGSTPLLAAGSLEEGDLEFVLDAFRIVRETAACRLLIAPRRLHLVEAMRAEIEARGLSVSQRSTPGNSEADVFLLDTMGELAVAYQFATAAFIGGTLKTGAGHNVVEPLVFGVPVSYGPNRGFFESVQRTCETEEIGFCVTSAQELATRWKAVLEDPGLRGAMSARAARLLETQTASLTVNLEMLLEQLQAVAEKRIS